jgi:hypothetical protein
MPGPHPHGPGLLLMRLVPALVRRGPMADAGSRLGRLHDDEGQRCWLASGGDLRRRAGSTRVDPEYIGSSTWAMSARPADHPPTLAICDTAWPALDRPRDAATPAGRRRRGGDPGGSDAWTCSPPGVVEAAWRSSKARGSPRPADTGLAARPGRYHLGPLDGDLNRRRLHRRSTVRAAQARALCRRPVARRSVTDQPGHDPAGDIPVARPGAFLTSTTAIPNGRPHFEAFDLTC